MANHLEKATATSRGGVWYGPDGGGAAVVRGYDKGTRRGARLRGGGGGDRGQRREPAAATTGAVGPLAVTHSERRCDAARSVGKRLA